MQEGLLAQHAHVAFRLNLSRHQLKLDYKAELEPVEEYARSLLAEFEVLALSSGDPNSAKRQRVPKLKEQDLSNASSSRKDDPVAAPKGAGKTRQPAPEAKGAERQPLGGTKVCTNWMSAAGCQYGDKCKFAQNVDEEAMKGRCCYCSSESHWANSCPQKAAARAEARAIRQGSAADGKGSKGSGKGKPTAKAQAGVGGC